MPKKMSESERAEKGEEIIEQVLHQKMQEMFKELPYAPQDIIIICWRALCSNVSLIDLQDNHR